jgi:membrane-associated protease RseP (regulator of RpoE activity)
MAGAREKMFESFFRTQVLWDESMASRVVDYLRGPAGEGKKMVVIAGGFHVRHGLGVPRRVLRRAAWPQAIVLPNEVSIPEELREELTMDVDVPEIPLIAGDFAWMVAYEDIEKKRVKLGVVLRTDEKTVLVDRVLPGSAAAGAGIQPGDAFVSIDDFPIEEQGDVILVISGKKEGDTAKVVLKRDGAEVTVTPTLTVPEDPPKH